MGQEAANFFFRSGELVKNIIEENEELILLDKDKYVYKRDNDFWIDIQLQDLNTLSIRITLCNPEPNILIALDKLLKYLFSYKNGVLKNLDSKEIFHSYNRVADDAPMFLKYLFDLDCSIF